MLIPMWQIFKELIIREKVNARIQAKRKARIRRKARLQGQSKAVIEDRTSIQIQASAPVCPPTPTEIQTQAEDKAQAQSEAKGQLKTQTDLKIEANIKCQTQAKPQRIIEPQVPLEKGDVGFDRYLRYSEIQNYLHRLATDYPKLVKVEDYGSSYEKRKLTLVYISKGGNKKKPIIFIEAGIHAREWIAISQALYIINQLVENSVNEYLIENIDWIIIPLMNPDGYVYSLNVDRLWRKTRSKGKVYDGVDLNRNFDYHWGKAGSSENESSNIYAGTAPFSEPETAAFIKIIEKYSHKIKLYLAIHSPALCLLYPWGDIVQKTGNIKELRNLAKKVARAIFSVNGTLYRVGSAGRVFKPSSGSSRDWVYGVKGIKLAFTLELPAYGDAKFEMPPEMILGVVEEAFEGIKEFHNYIKEKLFKNKFTGID